MTRPDPTIDSKVGSVQNSITQVKHDLTKSVDLSETHADQWTSSETWVSDDTGGFPTKSGRACLVEFGHYQKLNESVWIFYFLMLVLMHFIN